MKVFIIVLAVLIVLFCALCAAFAWYITHGKRQTMQEAWDWEQEHVRDAKELTRDMFTDYIVKGSKGEDIHTSLLPACEPSNRYVILAHGYTDNRYGMIKYAVHYRKLGFNCVLFDERGHGENAKEPCSYSVREVDFLLDVLKDTLERYGKDIVIGLQGESLGSATVLTSLRSGIVRENVRFVVEDCGFADIVPIILMCMKMVHVPAFMFGPINLFARMMYGISFKAARPIEAVKGSRIPLLVVHGAEDNFIYPWHGKEIFEAAEGPKEIRLFEKAGHAQSAVVDPDGYYEMLKAFIAKNV